MFWSKWPFWRPITQWHSDIQFCIIVHMIVLETPSRNNMFLSCNIDKYIMRCLTCCIAAFQLIVILVSKKSNDKWSTLWFESLMWVICYYITTNNLTVPRSCTVGHILIDILNSHNSQTKDTKSCHLAWKMAYYQPGPERPKSTPAVSENLSRSTTSFIPKVTNNKWSIRSS